MRNPKAGAFPLNFLHALRIRSPDPPSKRVSTAASANSTDFSPSAIVQVGGNPTEGPKERATLAKIPSIVPICRRCIRCVSSSSTAAHSPTEGSFFPPATAPSSLLFPASKTARASQPKTRERISPAAARVKVVAKTVVGSTRPPFESFSNRIRRNRPAS